MTMRPARYLIPAVLLAAFLMAAPASAGPVLNIPDSTFSFGFVPPHSWLSYPFRLYSTGDDTLSITKAALACGMVPKGPRIDTTIAPGDSVTIDLTMDTENVPMERFKILDIESNDYFHPHSIKITANVVGRPDSTYPVIIAPYKLDLSQLNSQSVDNADFEIKNVTDDPLAVQLVRSSAAYFSLELPETVPAHGSAIGHLTLKSERPDNSFEESFTFDVSTGGNTTRFTVPVKRTVSRQVVARTRSAR